MNGYYSYQFPEYLIPKGSTIIIYGAHDMGSDYAKHILKTGYCRVLAFADKVKAGRHYHQFEIIEPEKISSFSFDYVLIASTNFHEEIHATLLSYGICEEKIKYAEIRKLAESPSVVSNLCLEYFIAAFEHRKMADCFTRHPIQKILLESLRQYASSGILKSAEATKKLMDNLKVCDQAAVIYPFENERYFYGIAYTLMSYCGFRSGDWNALPGIHHGVMDYHAENSWPEYSPILISTPYQRNYNMPIIEAGPYIRYAKPYLDHSQTKALKDKLGRTLVAFPMHNDLTRNTNYDEEKFNQYLYAEKRNYDTVILCLHVFDLTEEKVKHYENNGILPVSLGVRMDQVYLSKLRSLLDLADVVLTNYIGSLLNHATALNKTVMWSEPDDFVADGISYIDRIPEYEEQKLRLIALLRHGETLSPEAIACCENLFRQQIFRSPEEMYAIFEMNEKIYHLSHGDRTLFKKRTLEYIDALKNSPDPGASLKYRIFRECTWNGVH
jgi:hypothetical protein